MANIISIHLRAATANSHYFELSYIFMQFSISPSKTQTFHIFNNINPYPTSSLPDRPLSFDKI